MKVCGFCTRRKTKIGIKTLFKVKCTCLCSLDNSLNLSAAICVKSSSDRSGNSSNNSLLLSSYHKSKADGVL
jgi:hypothetical protein